MINDTSCTAHLNLVLEIMEICEISDVGGDDNDKVCRIINYLIHCYNLHGVWICI